MCTLRRRLTVLGLATVVGSLWLPARAAELPGLGPRGDLVAIEFESAGENVLRGRNGRKQLLVTGRYSSGQQHDLTHQVKYKVSDAGVLAVSKRGMVRPLADGKATVVAQEAGGKSASIELSAESCQEELSVNFVNEVVPIFTKLGCNAGGCHGKADGQNGFKLSLLGFYPEDDYEYLVHEDRGRRIFPADPGFSLLLQKPANQLPHGGGARLSPASYEWELIERWIRQGMPHGSPDDPVLDRIEVVPPTRKMQFRGTQQLAVIGHYSDGSTRDVTQLASYEANDPETASAGPSGKVAVRNVPGVSAVMVRFQGQVGLFRAVVPQGLAVVGLPQNKNFMDELGFGRLVQLGIPPSALCDDSTFIRRATIDITGRLPTAERARQFLDDPNPNKRDQLIDELISSPAYADYFANKWAAVLRNKRRNENDTRYTYRFHAWIRRALAENMPYDRFVRGILTATGDAQTYPPAAWYREVSNSTQRMEDTAQLFLGIRLACAKCHHHPFERWSQQDYFGFEAFFTQVALKQSKFNIQTNLPDTVFLTGNPPISRNPRTGLDVKPTGLGGEPLEIAGYEDARHAMVDWMVTAENPFFAPALVNRYWKHFFGRGIVDPEDDMRVTNPASNPELLDALAKHFVEHGFDLADLVSTICKSNLYHLSSEPTEFNRGDKQNYSSFYPRRMPAEVLYDAMNQVAGIPANFGGVPQGTRAVQLPDNGFSNYFLQVFGKPQAESACECERSPEANLAQSLHLLNSADVEGRLRDDRGRAAAYARDEDRPHEEHVKELYLWAFSRPPRPDELEFVVNAVSQDPNRQQAYQDLVWALLNAKEFQFVR